MKRIARKCPAMMKAPTQTSPSPAAAPSIRGGGVPAPARPNQENGLFGPGPLLWRMAYETWGRAEELLGLDTGDLAPARRETLVHGKGGDVETIWWGRRQRGAAAGRGRG